MACLIGDRLRLDRPPATAVSNFLPLSAVPPFLARQESRLRPPSTSFRPKGCGPIVPDPIDSHRDPMSNGGDLF
ncbi:MAG: hypothetical protein DI607_00640 [Sphingomonas hengshuiensis]|nr:MAG: hypothetical protein DI607_00640 [Sphingomonas hengshuiensis]